MKVDLINQHANAFVSHLKQGYPEDELYRFECIQNFQTHWNLGTENLSQMFSHALSSTLSNRLWGGSRHSVKSMMLEFIAINPDYVRLAFRDLFTEDRDLVMRIDRFKVHCDELLLQLRSKDGRFNAHHHSTKSICMYLALRYPEDYCLFEYDVFVKALKKLGSTKLPAEYEIDRYMKVARIIHSFILKNGELPKQYARILHNSRFYDRPTLMMTLDFLQFVSIS
ncbi:MAG: hypothetical protein HKN87_20605 [Saprospiraceae bacterium]|nr:hypothetical protein [Saprospiraceae bacterium]